MGPAHDRIVAMCVDAGFQTAGFIRRLYQEMRADLETIGTDWTCEGASDFLEEHQRPVRGLLPSVGRWTAPLFREYLRSCQCRLLVPDAFLIDAQKRFVTCIEIANSTELTDARLESYYTLGWVLDELYWQIAVEEFDKRGKRIRVFDPCFYLSDDALLAMCLHDAEHRREIRQNWLMQVST